jgi:hypothetical protein
MPVVINELVIRAVVDTSAGGNQGRQSTPSQGGSDKDAIVAECVEQVMEILKRKRER